MDIISVVIEVFKYLDYRDAYHLCKVNKLIWTRSRTNDNLIFDRIKEKYCRYMEQSIKSEWPTLTGNYWRKTWRDLEGSNSRKDQFLASCVSNEFSFVYYLVEWCHVDPLVSKGEGIIDAVESGYYQIVEYLVKKVDVSGITCGKFGQCNLLELTILKGYSWAFRILLKYGNFKVDSGLLIRAIESGRDSIARILIQDGHLDPSADNNSALKMALRKSDLDTLRILLKDDRVRSRRCLRVC